MEHCGYDKKTGRPMMSVDDKDENNLDKFFGKSAQSRIWQTLFEWGTIDGTKTDIANSAEISRPSLYEAWPFFIEQEIIIPSRKVRGKQLYKLNPKHKLAKKYIDVMKEFLINYVDEEMAKDQVREKTYIKWKKQKNI
jgi:hypothetical protein